MMDFSEAVRSTMLGAIAKHPDMHMQEAYTADGKLLGIRVARADDPAMVDGVDVNLTIS